MYQLRSDISASFFAFIELACEGLCEHFETELRFKDYSENLLITFCLLLKNSRSFSPSLLYVVVRYYYFHFKFL